jgi:hypothetical protein
MSWLGLLLSPLIGVGYICLIALSLGIPFVIWSVIRPQYLHGNLMVPDGPFSVTSFIWACSVLAGTITAMIWIENWLLSFAASVCFHAVNLALHWLAVKRKLPLR